MSLSHLHNFILKLNRATAKDFGTIIKNMDVPKSEFEACACWVHDHYSRNCLARTDAFELILLCWKRGHDTPIHNHGGQRCWVYQVSGEVTEERYQKDASGDLVLSNELHLEEGQVTYMDDALGYHVLKNDSDEYAMSLHLYVAPIDACKIFNEESEVFETKPLTYDTEVSELEQFIDR